ncbi:Putative nucleoside-diphosphate sugar epimerase [Ignavibacterium album JCM 16511]|uniref:Putative nucleoside-diphosphate sugar epimerase n=2 Tax=Ignavibacterium album TaxID=591197 RepID=I0AFK1_IGNAJ|nr:Putative nucleoside-diphosphate sugar epimerase [Ignavibacterium album JCM 16511]
MITGQENQMNEVILNSFIMKTENRWRIVNDNVMGGLSSSRVIIENDKIIFAGNVSLENNGGFASIRSPVKNYDLSNFNGISIRLKADGKNYSISMKETSYFTGYFYTAIFETKADEWITIKIPFNQFKLYYFGKRINSDTEIPLDRIKEISFLIGDKQEGNFKAVVDYIKFY